MFVARITLPLGIAGSLLAASPALASVPPTRSFLTPASSNGFGAVVADLAEGRIVHFREHLYAAEEALLDAIGQPVWAGAGFTAVATRNLLHDAHFGLRVDGSQAWLTDGPVDRDASGFAPWRPGATGGTGVIRLVQSVGALRITQHVFAPRGLGHAGFVMAVQVQNLGASVAKGVAVFTLHDFHLGEGRPGVSQDIGDDGEQIALRGDGAASKLVETGFAGVVVARAIGSPAHVGASSASSETSFPAVVEGGAPIDLPDFTGTSAADSGWVSGYQFNLGDLPARGEAWAGVAFAHHGDPGAADVASDWIDAYVAGRSAAEVVAAEVQSWADLQGTLTLPAHMTDGDETLLRHSAVTLTMAQVQEDSAFLREHLSHEGEVRRTAFGTTTDGPPATLPATVAHRGKGAMIASLPPGEWTVAWLRDGAYSATAMAELGLHSAARDALNFFVNAHAGGLRSWRELASYAVPPYRLSLVRYQGFGVEETDFNDFGPNLEFDGFGLFLWALRHYETASGDTSLVDESWPTVSTGVGDALVALVDPSTGLLRPDSSIWETHWNGRQRTWAYSNLTAARGLCDAATLAARVGDTARASTYLAAGRALRSAIAGRLADGQGALASNAEELTTGEGYWDAAVIEGIALGLFDPKGRISRATMDGIDAHLRVPAGPGWSRNDDRFDHPGRTDLSPWGSPYDSAEWSMTDLRGAVALHAMGDDARAEGILAWVRDASLANYLAVSETYDEATGAYKFNAPMVGFGAAAFALAVFGREGVAEDPACGGYFEEAQ